MKPSHRLAPPATSAPDALELRGAPRVAANLPLELHVGGLPGALAGRTRDLGVTGLCAATSTVYDLRSLRRVVVVLPKGRIELGAEGCWQRDLRSDRHVLTGVAFTELPLDAADLLWDFVLDGGKGFARFLHAHSDLHGLGMEEALGLAQISRHREVAAGATIYRQETAHPGEDSIFLVASGAVALQLRVRDARETRLARLGPGMLFGGMPLVADAPHAESAVAESDVVLFEIDRNAYAHLARAKPWLAQRLGMSLARTYVRRLHLALSRLREVF
jgi:CRP-like cAMP-binding protein